MAKPIRPGSSADPTGQDRRERGAMRDFRRRVRHCLKLYRQLLARIDFEEVTVNAKAYTFRTDPRVISAMLDEVARLVDATLLEGGEQALWFTQDYVIPAYQAGTSQTWANLGAQSKAYRASRETLTQLYTSPPYLRRITLLRAREFEEMKGFAADLKRRMAFTLSQGLANGFGSLEIGRRLAEANGIDERRANTIARTEVNTALRTARLDESDQARRELSIETTQMQLSALSPTTRRSHRARHGTLHSSQEMRQWWSVDGNSINCKCTTVEVLVGSDGKPLFPDFVESTRAEVADE